MNTPDAVEPLGIGYLLFVALVFIGVLFGFYRHYMRFDEEEDKPDSK